MHYRGSPNKKLYRFELEPGPMEPPEADDEILQEGKKLAGPISSVNVVGWLNFDWSAAGRRQGLCTGLPGPKGRSRCPHAGGRREGARLEAGMKRNTQ